MSVHVSSVARTRSGGNNEGVGDRQPRVVELHADGVAAEIASGEREHRAQLRDGKRRQRRSSAGILRYGDVNALEEGKRTELGIDAAVFLASAQHRQCGGRVFVAFDQDDRAQVGNRQRVGRLEEHRPELGQLFERQRHRRELDLLDGIGQVRVRKKRRRGDGVLNHLPQQDRLRVQVAHGGPQHPLRLELGFVPVKREEVMQVERRGRTARQCSVGRARREVVVSQRGVG